MSTFLQLHTEDADAGVQPFTVAIAEIVGFSPRRTYDRGPRFAGIKGVEITLRGGTGVVVVESFAEVTAILKGSL